MFLTKEIAHSNWLDEGSSLKPFIVLEYLPETLSDVIRMANRKLQLPKTFLYCRQIASAILFLHSMNLVHRDIKPANIVITQDGKTAKLIDFGESRIVTGPKEPLTKVGTPFYEAFEVQQGKYTDKVDSYSFGKMMYEMVTKTINPSALAQRSFYETSGVDLTYITGAPDLIISLISDCCQMNPVQRPHFDQITEMLNELEKKYPS